MQRVIDGRRYLMRDQRTVFKLRELYKQFCKRYGNQLSLHQWLVERGKVYKEFKGGN